MEGKYIIRIFTISKEILMAYPSHTSFKFYEWISKKTLTELKQKLKEFEDVEMYEHCAIIRDKILTLKNR